MVWWLLASRAPAGGVGLPFCSLRSGKSPRCDKKAREASAKSPHMRVIRSKCCGATRAIVQSAPIRDDPHIASVVYLDREVSTLVGAPRRPLSGNAREVKDRQPITVQSRVELLVAGQRFVEIISRHLRSTGDRRSSELPTRALPLFLPHFLTAFPAGRTLAVNSTLRPFPPSCSPERRAGRKVCSKARRLRPDVISHHVTSSAADRHPRHTAALHGVYSDGGHGTFERRDKRTDPGTQTRVGDEACGDRGRLTQEG